MSAVPERWSLAQRRLHAWGAVLVVLTLALSLVMVALPMSQLLAKFLAYQLHKTFGLLVLIVTLARLGFRLLRRAPELAGLGPRMRLAARVGQGVLYALLLLVPLLGYLTAQAAAGPVPTTLFLVIPVPHLLDPNPALYAWLRPTHQVAAWSLIVLAAAHAALAMRHQIQGLGVLGRIWG
ncbi:MAG: cytochrome b/b6 domain-containing protein [Roseococcus sp.]